MANGSCDIQINKLYKWVIRMINIIKCVLFHEDWHVTQAYSNRTLSWKCNTCGRKWED